MTGRHALRAAGVILLSMLMQIVPAFGDPEVQVTHSAATRYLLSWSDFAPVDIFVGARPDARLSTMRLLDRPAHETQFEANLPDTPRPYFALRTRDGLILRTAERLLPLEGGSNFRDLGGYPGADGKHVRWGVLFRSAAMPKLTEADNRYLSSLNIKSVVDLRSVDERQLVPTDWRAKPGAHYIAIDYPGEVLFSRLQGYNGPEREQVTERLYDQFPALLRDEYKAVFGALLAHRVPMVIQGSAGQDRTGIAAALILSALGTPRPIIYQDYLRSIEDRKPSNEMTNVDLRQYIKTNSEARFLVEYRDFVEKSRRMNRPLQQNPPLRDSHGRPLLQDALEQIESDHGSIMNYLDRELGVHARDIAKLRALYLE